MTWATGLKRRILAIGYDAIIPDESHVYGEYDSQPQPTRSASSASAAPEGGEGDTDSPKPVRSVMDERNWRACPKRRLVDALTVFKNISQKRSLWPSASVDQLFRTCVRNVVQSVRAGVETVIFVFDKGVPKFKQQEAARRAAALAAAEAKRRAKLDAGVAVLNAIVDKQIAAGLQAPVPEGDADMRDDDDVPATPLSQQLTQPLTPQSSQQPLSQQPEKPVFIPAPYDEHCMMTRYGVVRFDADVRHATGEYKAMPVERKVAAETNQPTAAENLQVAAIETDIYLPGILSDRRLRAQLVDSFLFWLVDYCRFLLKEHPGKFEGVTFGVDAKLSRPILLNGERVHSGTFLIRDGHVWRDPRASTSMYLEADHGIGVLASMFVNHSCNDPNDPSSLQHVIVDTVDGDLLTVLLNVVFEYRKRMGVFQRPLGRESKPVQLRAGCGVHDNAGFTAPPRPDGYRYATEPHIVCILYHPEAEHAKIVDVNELLSLLMNTGISPAVVSLAAMLTKNDYLDKTLISDNIGVETIVDALVNNVRSDASLMLEFERMVRPWTRDTFFQRVGRILKKSLSAVTETQRDYAYVRIASSMADWNECGQPPRE